MNRCIYLLSDATGDTGERLLKAALLQFPSAKVELKVYPRVHSPEQLESILSRAVRHQALVFHTLVEPTQRQLLRARCTEMGVDQIDLIGGPIAQLAEHLHQTPASQPMGDQAADGAYYRRIEAIEFAMRCDNGQHPRSLAKADIVLLGISRTKKTPVSIYLARRGYKVANVPLVMGISLPRELQEIDPRRVYVLTIEPEALLRIRQQRLHSIGLPSNSQYGMADYIERELRWCQQFLDQHPEWTPVDVTDRAVEESALEIFNLWQGRFPQDVDTQKVEAQGSDPLA